MAGRTGDFGWRVGRETAARYPPLAQRIHGACARPAGPRPARGCEERRARPPGAIAIEGLSSSEALSEAANRWYAVVARGASGKDIRQLFERQGALVSRVLRVSIGAAKLDKGLARGQFRQLTDDEIESLLRQPARENAEP